MCWRDLVTIKIYLFLPSTASRSSTDDCPSIGLWSTFFFTPHSFPAILVLKSCLALTVLVSSSGARYLRFTDCCGAYYSPVGLH
jgi:hypothetical protein